MQTFTQQPSWPLLPWHSAAVIDLQWSHRPRSSQCRVPQALLALPGTPAAQEIRAPQVQLAALVLPEPPAATQLSSCPQPRPRVKFDLDRWLTSFSHSVIQSFSHSATSADSANSNGVSSCRHIWVGCHGHNRRAALAIHDSKNGWVCPSATD